MKINKTNAARLLDKAGVKYELIPYQVDETDLSAVHVASVLGEDVCRVYKTIVLRGDRNGIFVCVVPLYLSRNCFLSQGISVADARP